jgi:hypothetical protein
VGLLTFSCSFYFPSTIMDIDAMSSEDLAVFMARAGALRARKLAEEEEERVRKAEEARKAEEERKVREKEAAERAARAKEAERRRTLAADKKKASATPEATAGAGNTSKVRRREITSEGEESGIEVMSDGEKDKPRASGTRCVTVCCATVRTNWEVLCRKTGLCSRCVQKRRDCVVDPGKRSCRACATSKQKCDLDGNDSGKAVLKRRVAKKPRIVPSDSDDDTAPENAVSYDFWKKLHAEDRAAMQQAHAEDRAALREVHAADRVARETAALRTAELTADLIKAIQELREVQEVIARNTAGSAAGAEIRAECGVNTERTADAEVNDGAADEVEHGPEVGTNGGVGAEREDVSGCGSSGGKVGEDERDDEDETME